GLSGGAQETSRDKRENSGSHNRLHLGLGKITLQACIGSWGAKLSLRLCLVTVGEAPLIKTVSTHHGPFPTSCADNIRSLAPGDQPLRRSGNDRRWWQSPPPANPRVQKQVEAGKGLMDRYQDVLGNLAKS